MHLRPEEDLSHRPPVRFGSYRLWVPHRKPGTSKNTSALQIGVKEADDNKGWKKEKRDRLSHVLSGALTVPVPSGKICR